MAPTNDRLARAKAYLTIAESKDSKREAYKRAAKEIVAYKEETGDSIRRVATQIGKGERTIRDLIAWHDSGFKTETPFAGEELNRTKAISHAKSVLAKQPMEVVEQVIADLPKDRQRKIGAAAGDAYLRESEKLIEQKQRKTPKERREVEAFVEKTTRPVKKMLGELKGSSVVDLLGEATEELRQIIADEAMTPKVARKIEQALEEFQREFEFAQQLAGGE